MTDANFMEADCVHGGVWHDCDQCSADDQEIRDAERRTLRILVARIELLLAEADASIRSGDDWSNIFIHVGDSTEKLT
ncbi:hypothetical protein [Ilumatobacter sp.]|uniref:hypothetical protein n=1 Tax=Ilumatobacter sp. TaxID=1967498 RepID=UPI003751059B